MAYAALVYVDQQLENLLPKHDKYIHLYEKKQMESLHSNVISLEKFLEDFPGRRSSLIKKLESQITHVAYKVGDIIGWGISEGKHRKQFESCMKSVDSIVKNAKEIRKVLEMKSNMLRHDSPITTSSSTVAAPSDKSTMVGLDRDLSQMKERILGRNLALQVIPVTGMGGIGKTTLAKNVYEDPVIVAHFDVRSWVTVSQEHNTEKILKEILGDTKRKDRDTLIEAVHKKLTGRRFLIIIDDIWNVEAWDRMRNALQDDNKGSRVVITTRLTEVATKVGSSSLLHEMQLMNEVQSWELFHKEAFGQNERCPPQLEHIGKTISNNCKGLPLAIVVIARLLKLNSSQEYWGKFDRNMNEAMAETHDDQLMEILSLSYDNLPSHLKACFLYMSMFPEDADIPTQKLKWLWVADGFLKPTGGKRVEQVAEKCLLDLCDRNLLSVGKRSSNDKIKTCTIHDLLRDLSLRKAQEDKFSQQIMALNTVHRRCTDTCNPAISKTKYGYIYSLICHGKINYEDMLPTMRSKLVRVLDVLKTPFTGSMSFGVNLRYLAFSYSGGYNDFNATLAKLRGLQNLETLIINHNVFSETLCFPMLEMPKLKHFIVHAQWSRYCIIYNHNKSISKKSMIKTLSGVRDIELTADVIEILGNLVKLKIMYDRLIIDRVCLNNLVCLIQLEKLNLNNDNDDYFQLPTNIAFPEKLKKITLRGFKISWETMSVTGSLPNLQVLKLVNCKFESRVWEPVEGEFQQLKYLKLRVPYLVEWKVESEHFPCLEQLILDRCYELKQLPAEVGEIESLQKLVVLECYKRVLDSARKILEEQQRYGNYQLHVFVERPLLRHRQVANWSATRNLWAGGGSTYKF